MSLRNDQVTFTQHLIHLIDHIFEQGDEVTFGEVARTQEQQKIYFDTGRSKTMLSEHINRCAADLFVFRNGRLLTHEEMVPYGKFWEDLDEKNRWGGSWRGQVECGKSKFIDTPHFERRTV